MDTAKATIAADVTEASNAHAATARAYRSGKRDRAAVECMFAVAEGFALMRGWPASVDEETGEEVPEQPPDMLAALANFRIAAAYAAAAEEKEAKP